MISACRYKTISEIIFLSLLVFFSVVLNSYALENQGPENADTKSKKNRLIARDIGFGVSIYRWCGNDRLLIYGEKGSRLLDLKGTWTIVSTNKADYPLNCTRDGKWVIYVARGSAHIDKGAKVPENFDVETSGWDGDVLDLYRYEVATSKRQKFAVVQNRGNSQIYSDAVSPDGSKVFLGNKHNTPVEMPKPEWKVYWFMNQWNQYIPRWLADSSGIVTEVVKEDYDSDIGVEIFGEKGWTKIFKWDSSREGKIHNLTVDEKSKIYFLTTKEYTPEKPVRKKRYFHRCELKDKKLDCEMIFEADNRNNIISYFVLSEGDIVFQEELDNCIRRFSPYQTEAGCIVSGPDLTRFYGVSPDGKRLAFERHTWEADKKYNRYDLYIMELNN